MLLDTWHTYKQRAKELPIWTPHITKTLILLDASLFGHRDEDFNGHGGKPVDESLLMDSCQGWGFGQPLKTF